MSLFVVFLMPIKEEATVPSENRAIAFFPIVEPLNVYNMSFFLILNPPKSLYFLSVIKRA